jgi:hypothetical protein
LSRIDSEEFLVPRLNVRRVASVLIAMLALSFLLAASASARDLSSSIADAEARAGAAAAEVDDLKGAEAPVAHRFEAAVRRAAPMRGAVRSANRRMVRIEHAEHVRRTAARTKVQQIESANRKAAEKHDDKVTSGIGFGLAAVILGLIVLAWGWFRASAAVAALTRVTLGQAIGLGVGLAAAFLLARHSAEIQRGRSRPLLRRDRWSVRATQVLAAVLGVLCLIALGTAVFAPAAKSNDVSTALRAQAASAGGTPALAAAEQRVSRLEAKTSPLLAVVHHDKADLRQAKRAVGHAHDRMVGAEKKAASFTRRLVSLEVRERRQAEVEERREQKAAEAEEREYEKTLVAEEKEAEEAAEESACDPNYVGECLKDGIGDYDCAEGDGNGPNYVYSPVEVVGADPFGLDEDGDGVGCQDE